MPFADELLGVEQVATLVAVLDGVAPDHDWSAVRSTTGEFDGLALGARARLVGDVLAAALGTTAEADRVFGAALGDARFEQWMIWPVTEAVATLATTSGTPDDLDLGLDLLARLTPRLTAEFALRPFLLVDLDRTLAAAMRWTDDPDEHVRRLASEGTRLRLPWGKQIPALNADPARTIPILDRLYRDGSETVRRSVANHLNDTSRNDPSLAVATARRWTEAPDDRTGRVVKHALRTRVKAADPDALALLGFGTADQLDVRGPVLDVEAIVLGDHLAFEVEVTNRSSEPVRLVVDFVVHYRKADGSLAPKVFKLTTATLDGGESRTFAKRHAIRPITTRRHHPGEHALEIQVNGSRHGRTRFDLALP